MEDENRRKPKLAIATGQTEMIAQLTQLKERFERGEVSCAALRVYNADGTWEDVVLGGADDHEREQALEDLRRSFRDAH